MVRPPKSRFHITEECEVQFNKNSNFCGRESCVFFNVCGQALSALTKERLESEGLTPKIDTDLKAVTCYSRTRPARPTGTLQTDNTPDWPAREM